MTDPAAPDYVLDILDQFPIVSQSFRRAILHRFPFGVFFTLEAQLATVMAITHLHRDPKQWQRRE
ncbi:MAG: hypothetical protein ACREUU_01890 [Gammaproteobacteria bacterium]